MSQALPSPPPQPRPEHDVCVVGKGAVGASLALSLAALGLEVAWVAPQQAAPGSAPPAAAGDVRAYALNAASVALLRRLKAWDALPLNAATPVRDMLIEGDDPGATLEFSAWRQRVGELAFIVDAAALEHVLHEAARFAPRLHRVPAPVPATLVAHAEGRASDAAAAHGVAVSRHGYGHTAVAARLTADLSHQGVAHQWFRAPQVLALLPLDRPKATSSWGLVWSVPDATAAALITDSVEAFEAQLHQAVASRSARLGRLHLASERVAWPLTVKNTARWCGPGWVLLGDAAHQVHPLAGQGLNLGFADVSALTAVLASRESWRPVGDERLLRRYERARIAPTQAMTQLTDGLWHLFASQAPLVRPLRNQGLKLVDRAPWAKRWLAARALDT